MKGQPHRGDGAKVVEGGPLQDQKRRALPGFQMAGIAGIGVGLYVSREIVRRHGGHISLRPREGGGAVATVRLPAAAEPEHDHRVSPTHQEEGRGPHS